MDEIDEFIEHYQPKLLCYLDAKLKSSSDEPGPPEFVEQVLDNWAKLAAGRKLRRPNQRERTFWFALYQFEELVEMPVSDQIDDYEGFLMQNLAEVRELLRDWSELPDGFYATRPGENPDAL